MARTQHLTLLATSGIAAISFAVSTAFAAPATATVENKTRPTACAEEDNVSMVLRGQGITNFRVEALQPSYIDKIEKDVTTPDFSACNFDGGDHPTDPSYKFKARRVVLYDGPQWTIVGMTLPSFWRPNRVPVRVGARSGNDFHLVQVFAKGKEKGKKPMEAMVLYPADGYWRLKPLPLARFGDGVYGSSFLMGPVEDAGRPVVNISSITIQTQPLSFRLRFANGGSASVKVAEISEERTALDVSLHPATQKSQPFAVLRSMYLAVDNADVSELTWQSTRSAPPETKPLPEISSIEAAQVRFARTTPSRHNTSAPDIRFSDFETARRN
ncbi:hypothetical protein [Variovorax sp. Sphag1AA]|uniref:hypothetical protein n=1 Tax=Variovorax sp. Sphag1AA TaxID=2587027 RepID=UPI0017A0AF4E|nr:hypothetical protein [Variovorax sp. Sphag1AA]MBB3177878.1 hypothetical protein [Variovorax sp. Sphag1AA]